MTREPHLPTESEPAALRDAADIVARTAADEADAVLAREQYRRDGLKPTEPDAEIGARLAADEWLVEVRPAAMVAREDVVGRSGDEAIPVGTSAAALSGRLYLTSARLVLLSRSGTERQADEEIAVDLADIEELAVVGERLLVSLSDGAGLAIDAGRPRTLRVQIAAARAASRGEGRPATDDGAAAEGATQPAAPGLGPAPLPLEA